MDRKIVQPAGVPKPLAAYSTAIRAGDFLFIAGNVGIDPKTGKIVKGGVQAQTRRIMENMKIILKSEGLSLNNLVKVNVFLQNVEDFKKMNAAYASFFKGAPPTRTTVGAKLALPGLLVEIEGIAKT